VREKLREIYRKRFPKGETTRRTIRFYTQDNFTICIVGGEFVGVAKRNPKSDVHNQEIGENIAFSRAVKEMT